MSELEQRFIDIWEISFPMVELHREYPFAKSLKRKYRADFANIESKVIIEIQGGIYGKGGHSSISGIKRDCEKFFCAAQLGWYVFPLYADMIEFSNLKIIADVIVARKPKDSYADICKMIA